MPIFRYRGYKRDGLRVSGTIEAGGLKDAVSAVRNLEVFPKEVAEYVSDERRFLFGKKYGEALPTVARQLSTLLVSGVPVVEALKTLSEESTGYWKSLLIDVREKVSAGAGLSRALESYTEIFPESFVTMVSAGEQSGTLDKVLDRLAGFLEKQASTKAQVKIAMIYPMMMICVGFIVMSFLFTFVIPKIVKIFEDTKSALPLITVVLITISNFFVHYWWLLACAAAALAAGIRKVYRTRRDLIDRAMLRLPGDVVQSLYYTRFSRTLGFLLEGGLPMLRALDLSAKAIGNSVYEKKVRDAVKRVAEGSSLSSSLEGFPPVLLQLIATGEKSGRIVEVLNKAADSYEDVFGRSVKKALSLLEPAMILAMGFVVSFIVLAVLLPMFQLNQLVK
ncbi:MAG TPA: type II secretion system F family protein [Dissulfurispiraceae bacterium]|nr:type II secretion system F family protein [Dissulfurispiraceae bacterium]